MKSVHAPSLATEGNGVSTGFNLSTKLTAVRCWQAAVDASGLDDKVLASDARISKGHYSKLATGQQGDLLGLAYRIKSTHPALFNDFLSRLAEAERIDPVAVAAEQLASAALRFLRLTGSMAVPLKMAKAQPRDDARQAVSE